MLEVLDRLLVLLRRRTARKRPQVLALSRLLIGMAAIDTKFAGFDLTNHACLRCRVPTYAQRETAGTPYSIQLDLQPLPRRQIQQCVRGIII